MQSNTNAMFEKSMRNLHIETKTLREQAYEAIKDMILKHDFLPNEGLSISSLAGALGISQTPVREALGRLSADGLIDYEPHKRLRVAAITEEDVRQAYEVRKLLEPYAASLVASSVSTDADLKKNLRTLYEKAKGICETAVDLINFESYLSVDLELNDIFLKVSGHTLFREVLGFVSDRSLRIRTFLEAVYKTSPNNMVHVITKEHLQILEALLKGDPAKAQARVRKHLDNGETRTLKAIKNKLNV
jgi:DNA-binding GntR family transcriptional regulator